MQPTLSLIRQAPRSVYFLFLTRFTIYFLRGKVKFAPGFVHDFKTADFAWIHRYFSYIPCSLLTALCSPPIAFSRGLSEISSLAFFHLLCYNPNRLTECSMRGSALVLRSIQSLDDEDQIAREPVFRAERIPERIDRPMPRIHVRGLSAFCLKVIFTACSRRHAFFFIRLSLPDSWQLNAFYFLFGTITLSQCPDH